MTNDHRKLVRGARFELAVSSPRWAVVFALTYSRMKLIIWHVCQLCNTHNHLCLAVPRGLEPLTPALTRQRSTS
jgi:hypothetical protein